MKRGKDDDKNMGPMFPRLHVNDTGKGGPRAPPRNKMALYEQLSIPSQRFSQGLMSHNQPANTANIVPSASSGQVARNERNTCFSNHGTSRHTIENQHITSSPQTEQKKKSDEDDFRVPIFFNSMPSQDHANYFNNMGKENPARSPSNPNQFRKFQKTKHDSQKEGNANEHNWDQLVKDISNSSSAEKNEEPEYCGDSGNGVFRDRGNSASMRDVHSEERNVVQGLSNDTESLEERFCGSRQVGNMDRADSMSETSMLDSISAMEISPDDVVGVIGQKHFWKARRAIVNQQRVFAVQVFELHRLIKVQSLIAGSPHLLLEDAAYFSKPIKSTPSKKLPLDYIPKPLPNISKPKTDSEKTSHKVARAIENTDGKSSFSSNQNGTKPFPPNPAAPTMSNDHSIPPWCYNPSQGHQWLIPVMTPSEGLVYKPYPAPPGVMGPAHLGCGPAGPGNFSNPAYGIPSPYHQYPIPSFPPPSPHGYYPSYGMPMMNPAFSGSSVEQMNHPQTNHVSSQGPSLGLEANLDLQRQNSITSLAQKGGAHVPNVAKDLQGSTASSPNERLQSAGGGKANEGRQQNVLPLFPTSPAVDVRDSGPQTMEPEHHARVIKVVPHNARSATESAARIFRSIQQERKQYDSA